MILEVDHIFEDDSNLPNLICGMYFLLPHRLKYTFSFDKVADVHMYENEMRTDVIYWHGCDKEENSNAK